MAMKLTPEEIEASGRVQVPGLKVWSDEARAAALAARQRRAGGKKPRTLREGDRVVVGQGGPGATVGSHQANNRISVRYDNGTSHIHDRGELIHNTDYFRKKPTASHIKVGQTFMSLGTARGKVTHVADHAVVVDDPHIGYAYRWHVYRPDGALVSRHPTLGYAKNAANKVKP